MTATSPSRAAASTSDYHPIFYVGPVSVAILLFYVGPILFGVWSGFQANATAMTGGEFVGFTHYKSLAQDPQFHNSMRVTLVFTIATVIGTYVAGLLAALLLNAEFVGRSLVGSILVIPWTMPLVVVGVVWGWLLDYQFGAINYLLEVSGVSSGQIGFLTDTRIALWSVAIAHVWRLFPLAMVTLLAALKAIPGDLYEAAMVDGATRWQTFRHVTIPGLRSTSSALLLLLGIWIFGRAFVITFIMTGGGPAGASETLAIQTYLEAFRYFALERASALGTLVLVVAMILTAFYIRARSNVAQS